MNKEINVMSLNDNVRKWEQADKEVSQANKESSVPGVGMTGHPGEAFLCGDLDTSKDCGYLEGTLAVKIAKALWKRSVWFGADEQGGCGLSAGSGGRG